MNIALLASTSGSNLPSFFATAKDLGITCILVTNKKECGAVQKAKNEGIESIFIDPKNKTREQFDTEMKTLLKTHQIDYVFCIGYMRIISPVLIDAYQNKIYNVHPSLLPAFAGGMDTDVHSSVLERGCKITGATLHFMTEEIDGGPIVDQKACRVEFDDTPEILKAKVQKLEREMLEEELRRISIIHS